ncbi:MAG: sigma-70 family RNA polymerase sigma factor [Clostridia bacterium]|nr:sigma-70 family RNA polymerase sigma factor [Clostridia bacterium]
MEQNNTDRIVRAVHETIRGNTEAYNVIVTAFMQKLYFTARSLSISDAQAEDLVQETLIDGYLHLSRLREPEKIEGWLMRILKNKALNYLTRTRRTESEDALAAIADKRTPEMLTCATETMREWRDRLISLSPALRQTAILYFWYHLSMEEIARRTDVPLGTVKRRIHDAREKLKKENDMNTQNTLPDSFAEALAKKIKELADYTKTYGSVGFDSAYTNVKELIANLSDAENVKSYSVQGAEIAAQTDMGKYAEDSLAVYRKFNEPKKASWLYLDLCWRDDNKKHQYDYTVNTILPALAEYPDSEEKHAELGYHMFWMAHYTDKSTDDGKAEAREWLNRAMAEFESVTFCDAPYANTVAALKGLDALDDGRQQQMILVTGEKWGLENGNLKMLSEPGCWYSDSGLHKFHNYVNMSAGNTGDGWFFPRTIALEAGAEERMIDDKGTDQGVRRVISMDETVTTPAGRFTDCMHIEKIDADNDCIHAWYAKGVGLVKVSDGDPVSDKVLASYEIKGGDGYFPCAVGNTWRYENPAKPDALHECNEYVIEQMGRDSEGHDAISISALNYIALEPDWEETTDDPALLFSYVGTLCEEGKYPEAAEKLREIVMANRSRESVDQALAILEYLDEKLVHDKAGWRYCPSSANIATISTANGRIAYSEGAIECYDMGPWGSRGEENRIFGAKPFRYLQQLCHTLWDDKWIPGFTAEYPHDWKDGTIKLTVDDGGTVETPAGTFENTVHLTIDAEVPGNPDDYGHYFYDNTECGVKEYWFAPGVGVVRFKCTWGKHLDSDCLLTEYRTVAAPGEMMPVHIGCRWRYEEQLLTRENYIARRDYKVLSGMNGNYTLADSQMFTWRGNVEEYEEFKRNLAK